MLNSNAAASAKGRSRYKWTLQPYKSWKGKSTNAAVAVWSRPYSNYTMPSSSGIHVPDTNYYNDTAHDYSSADFTARPIKHWRKQLKPTKNSGSHTIGVDQVQNTPGGTTYLGTDSSDCAKCETDINQGYVGHIKTLTSTTKNTPIYINKTVQFWDPCKEKLVCISCNPENNIIRPASSKFDKRYYQTTSAYLQSRVKLYDQNLSRV